MSNHIIQGFIRPLNDRELEIYEGRSGLSELKRQQYLAIWSNKPVPQGDRKPAKEGPACPHLGERTGQTVGCRTCSGLAQIDTYRCGLFGLTVLGDRAPASDEVRACRWCSERPRQQAKVVEAPPVVHAPGPVTLQWISTTRLAADSIVLAGKLPPDVTAVAGIPRSGMIPASIIAAHLHLPLYELPDGGKLTRLGHGSRGRSFGFPSGGRVAVIDDTSYGGGAMARARQVMGSRAAVFAVVYARTPGPADVFASLLPSPHLLEWNVMNNGPFTGGAANPVYRGGIGLDLDGVIVHDEASGGPPGSPYLVPRTRPCKLIATGRAERHRPQTEALLRRIGAQWDRLEMLPDDVALTPEAAAAHKAKHYKASDLGFFIESDFVQARLIFELAGKPVVCPVARKVFQ